MTERTGAYLIPGPDLGSAVELAQQAEAWGYENLWVTHGTERDSFLVLSAYAHATRTIGLGNGVVPIYPGHLVALAQEALTLAELSPGRFRLGLGVSHRSMMTDGLGLEMGNPLQVMRENVAVLRAALAGRVDYRGARYRASWQSGMVRLPGPPAVLLAGLSTKMLELAGEIADGVILWLCAPAYIREVALPAVGRGRARAGKSLQGFEVVAAVPVALTASGFGEALAAFDRESSGRSLYPRAVPNQLAGALGGIGDSYAVHQYVAAYREAGVTLPAIRPIGFPDASHYRSTLQAFAS